MKRKLAMIICMILIMVTVLAAKKEVVSAAGDYTRTNLKFTKVEDIDVYNDYIINDIFINNTLYDNLSGLQVYKFTLESDGFIKLLLAAGQVKKSVIRSNSATINTTDAQVTATVYRDSMLLYPVVPQVTAKGNSKGESTQKIALDQGTYYIAIKTDKYDDGILGGVDVTTAVQGEAHLVLYYQEVESYELYRPSNVGKENPITFDGVYPGLLTATNPKDYYTFNLTEKALVKFNFMYDSTKNAIFNLYGVDREVLVTKTLAGNNVWYNIEKYLEPGKYYCSLQTVAVNDGGRTNLMITKTDYTLRLKQENVTTNSYITVETIDTPKDIRFVKGKLTNSEMTSSKWKSGKVITDTLQFGVNMTGYYTVRVTDEYGNMFMQSINVTSCDKKAPNKPTIENCKVDTFVVTGTAERNALVTVSVNGKPYYCNANTGGIYECELPYKLVKGHKLVVTAQDISGNVSAKAIVTIK